MNTRKASQAFGLSAAALVTAAALAQTSPPSGDFYWLDETFGANCYDGLPDDGPLLAGLQTVASAGGTLVFPAKGDCIVSGALDVTGGGHFVLEGNGATIRTQDGAPVEVGIGSLRYFSSSHFEIRNLTFDGNRDTRALPDPDASNPTVNNLLVLRGVTHAVVHNVRVVDAAGDGIYVAGDGATTPSRNVRLTSCVVERAARNGIGVTNADGVVVSGCAVSGTNGVLPRAGIDIEPGGSESVSSVAIVDSSFGDNDGAGIQVSAAHGPVHRIRIIGNEVARNKRAALRIGGDSLIVANNRVHSHEAHALNDDAVILVLGQATKLQFSGNQISDIDADRDVLWVRAGVLSAVVDGNSFSDIGDLNGTNDSYFAVIRADVPGASIHGNSFRHIRQRAVWSTGDHSTITDNVMTGMQKTVVLARGVDVTVSDNTIGPLDVAGGGTSDDAVIRFRGSGGIVSGNTISCPVGTQFGFFFDVTPNVVSNNTVRTCGPLTGPTKGFRYANGVVAPGHLNNIWY